MKKALERLKRERTLLTGDLKKLGLTFEHFLRFCQLSDERCDLIVTKLIERTEKKLNNQVGK